MGQLSAYRCCLWGCVGRRTAGISVDLRGRDDCSMIAFFSNWSVFDVHPAVGDLVKVIDRIISNTSNERGSIIVLLILLKSKQFLDEWDVDGALRMEQTDLYHLWSLEKPRLFYLRSKSRRITANNRTGWLKDHSRIFHFPGYSISLLTYKLINYLICKQNPYEMKLMTHHETYFNDQGPDDPRRPSTYFEPFSSSNAGYHCWQTCATACIHKNQSAEFTSC